MIPDSVAGGGKCNFALQRTKKSLREEGGGSGSSECEDPMLKEARNVIELARERLDFPDSLW